MTFPVRTLIALAFLVGIVFLQIFLSKNESKFPGLVLPIISFLVAILFVMNMAMPPEGVAGGFVWDTIVVFLLANTPTLILLAIYFASRKSNSRKKQLDRMNIQDLN